MPLSGISIAVLSDIHKVHESEDDRPPPAAPLASETSNLAVTPCKGEQHAAEDAAQKQGIKRPIATPARLDDAKRLRKVPTRQDRESNRSCWLYI